MTDTFTDRAPAPPSPWLSSPLRRLIELAVTVGAITLSLPAQVAAFLAVGLLDGMPVLYRQEREGILGQRFVVTKFRTLAIPGSDSPAAHATPLGRILRTTSVDELPQLYLVLSGAMSLIGPRPLVERDLALADPAMRERRRLARPGLTGLAQVSGRNALSWPEKFQLDMRYVQEASPWTDLAILGRTLLVAFLRRGIWSDGQEGGSGGTGGAGPVALGESRGPPESGWRE